MEYYWSNISELERQPIRCHVNSLLFFQQSGLSFPTLSSHGWGKSKMKIVIKPVSSLTAANLSFTHTQRLHTSRHRLYYYQDSLQQSVMKVSHSQFQSKSHQSNLASKRSSHTHWFLLRKVDGGSKSELNLIKASRNTDRIEHSLLNFIIGRKLLM